MPLLGTILALVLLASTSWAAGLEAYGANLGSLISPSKLATLGRHGANQRVQKAVHLLELAQRDRLAPALVLDEALRRVSLTGQVARLTKEALLRNHHIARTNGCLDEAGMWEMAHGKAPTIQSGPSREDELSVDHIIPYSIAPELDKVLANLELCPLRQNSAKGAKLGPRQRRLAQEFYEAGLIGGKRLEQIRKAVP